MEAWTFVSLVTACCDLCSIGITHVCSVHNTHTAPRPRRLLVTPVKASKIPHLSPESRIRVSDDTVRHGLDLLELATITTNITIGCLTVQLGSFSAWCQSIVMDSQVETVSLISTGRTKHFADTVPQASCTFPAYLPTFGPWVLDTLHRVSCLPPQLST